VRVLVRCCAIGWGGCRTQPYFDFTSGNLAERLVKILCLVDTFAEGLSETLGERFCEMLCKRLGKLQVQFKCMDFSSLPKLSRSSENLNRGS
jgi:hypothetical protein